MLHDMGHPPLRVHASRDGDFAMRRRTLLALQLLPLQSGRLHPPGRRSSQPCSAGTRATSRPRSRGGWSGSRCRWRSPSALQHTNLQGRAGCSARRGRVRRSRVRAIRRRQMWSHCRPLFTCATNNIREASSPRQPRSVTQIAQPMCPLLPLRHHTHRGRGRPG